MASIVEEMVFESKTLPPGFEVLLEQKAADLFAICDQEDKGFITKRDMQRLKNELPLGPDQLENVFDALDQDANGYLTLEEFTQGFEGYLGIDPVSNFFTTTLRNNFSEPNFRTFKLKALILTSLKHSGLRRD